ncbi:MAG: hypothetical protein O2817_06455 [Proteobacteria bacterium]|nr:hypothetical protein [Pseudomonadota bacterium]
MARAKKPDDISPLDKWRQGKDKVLDADSVEMPPEEKDMPPPLGHPGGLTYIPIQAPPPKGDATMLPGQAMASKGEATMLPGQSMASKGEATMLPGQSMASKGEATMLPGQSMASKGEATMLPGQSVASKGEATMLPGQSVASKGEATMLSGQSRASKGEPKMVRSGNLRRRGADPKMMAGTFRPSKSQATMLTTTRARPKLSADAHDIAQSTVKTFINELRSIANRQGMDFSIDQQDDMSVDFFTRSKMLRVSFTGREIDIDRIVFMDNGRLRVAPARNVKKGVFDWDDTHPPQDLGKVSPDNRVAIEAHFVDSGDNRDCHIELVNRPPDAVRKTGTGPAITADGARRLVMLLLDSLSSSTGTTGA